jgi:hypothetical protein
MGFPRSFNISVILQLMTSLPVRSLESKAHGISRTERSGDERCVCEQMHSQDNHAKLLSGHTIDECNSIQSTAYNRLLVRPDTYRIYFKYIYTDIRVIFSSKGTQLCACVDLCEDPCCPSATAEHAAPRRRVHLMHH